MVAGRRDSSERSLSSDTSLALSLTLWHQVAERAIKWASLRKKKNSDKKLAITVFSHCFQMRAEFARIQAH